ncbi:MAG TPA: rod shape-determining protein RodA [Armatimonadaceae bacterium]|nr:rod shape-determining protein RodA [Armatimonadaceae bacterium]
MTTLIEPRLRRNIDWILLLAVVAVMCCSLATLYAAMMPLKLGAATALRQGVYFSVGIAIMGFVATRDYGQVPRYVPFLYGANLLLLLAVEVFSPEVKGAQRWIPLPIPGMDFKLQPSEFAKISVILTLSAYVTKLGTKISEFPSLMKTLFHIGVPMALIMKQPDLGTSLVVLAIWTGIVFLAGARVRHLLGLACVGAALFAFAWQANILHDYQKDRVFTFINPMHDPKGEGYHVLQSQIAIGGGQVTGQGYGQGLQTNLRFIPENQTDFIFTVVGEETGFVGACVLIGIYGLILWRGIATVATSEDPLGRLIAGGVTTMLAFHVVVNVGMTCGIMPVVGVPLPLMSFGGSAAWANLTGIGLILGAHLRRHKLQF